MNKFAVGVESGVVHMYVFVQTNIPPIIINHGSLLSSLEVIKFQDRIITGGNDGKMRLWNIAAPGLFLDEFNSSGALGGKVTDISFIITTDYFISVHFNSKINIWKITGIEKHLVTYTIPGSSIPYTVFSILNTKEFLVGFSNKAVKYYSDNIDCHSLCKSCSGVSEFECNSCFTTPLYILTPSSYCKKYCDLSN